MRVGTNPNRAADVKGFAPVVVTVITHLPNVTTAYHAKRLEVIQACLRTMRDGANIEHTFCVWDNGSLPELRNWIQYDFKPDMFVQSANVGKINARTALTRMFPPDTIMTFSDDDMLFYRDWLRPQIEILQHFPNVASVTGYPVRTSFRWGNDNTLAWARKNGKLESGRFLPQEWEDDFAVSVGRDINWHKEYTVKDIDWRVTYKGMKAYATGHHCQFIGYAGQVAKACVYDHQTMADEKPFDIRMDAVGLRLATVGRHARHMGNVIDEKLRSELWQLLA